MKAFETKLFQANMDYVSDPVSFCNELQEVLDYSGVDSMPISMDCSNIVEAFSWANTPQGFDYWNNIYCQIDAARGRDERQE